MSNDTPLVWTTKGNLPIADLTYHTDWAFSPGSVTFIETYMLGDEIVKRSVHVHAIPNEG